MILMSKQRPTHMVLVKEVARGMAVVNREHVTALEAPADFADPVACFQPRFGMLALAQHNALCRKILGDGASRERRYHVYKAAVAETNENLFHRAAVHHDSMHGQRIHQFIGKKAPRSDVCWNLSTRREMSSKCMALSVNRRLFPPRRGALHGDIAQSCIKRWELRLTEIQNLRSEPPRASASLNQGKFRRAPEAFPHIRELPRQQTRKNRMHIHARVVVGEALGLRFAVISMHRMVQAFAHVV